MRIPPPWGGPEILEHGVWGGGGGGVRITVQERIEPMGKRPWVGGGDEDLCIRGFCLRLRS